VDKWPKIFQRCCFKKTTKIHKELSQGNMEDIAKGIKESFDLKRIIRTVHEVAENQKTIMRRFELGSKKKNVFDNFFSRMSVIKKKRKKDKPENDVSITKKSKQIVDPLSISEVVHINPKDPKESPQDEVIEDIVVNVPPPTKLVNNSRTSESKDH